MYRWDSSMDHCFKVSCNMWRRRSNRVRYWYPGDYCSCPQSNYMFTRQIAACYRFKKVDLYMLNCKEKMLIRCKITSCRVIHQRAVTSGRWCWWLCQSLRIWFCLVNLKCLFWGGMERNMKVIGSRWWMLHGVIVIADWSFLCKHLYVPFKVLIRMI